MSHVTLSRGAAAAIADHVLACILVFTKRLPDWRVTSPAGRRHPRPGLWHDRPGNAPPPPETAGTFDDARGALIQPQALDGPIARAVGMSGALPPPRRAIGCANTPACICSSHTAWLDGWPQDLFGRARRDLRC